MFLLGEPGTGKTKFIESYCIDVFKLTPLIINNFDALKYFDDIRHNAIIIDDICLKHCDRSTVIKLLDSEDSTTFRVTYHHNPGEYAEIYFKQLGIKRFGKLRIRRSCY